MIIKNRSNIAGFELGINLLTEDLRKNKLNKCILQTPI